MLDWHSCQICYPLEIKILLLLLRHSSIVFYHFKAIVSLCSIPFKFIVSLFFIRFKDVVFLYSILFKDIVLLCSILLR